MTVTPRDRRSSCNEWEDATAPLLCRDGVIWNVRCIRCGVRFDIVSDYHTEVGTPGGKIRLADVHCCSCQSRGDHNSCLTCGKCLPRWIPIGSRYFGGVRLDARYCSNACRQKAYRQRRTS